MKNISTFTGIIITLFLYGNLNAQIPKGTLIATVISSESVSSNNKIFSDVIHPVLIYLPPSYYTNTYKKYPVLYYLGGYSEEIYLEYKDYTSWSGGYHIYNSNNLLLSNGNNKEMIMVIAQGLSEIKGAFYTNSEATSYWEDFVVKDLVNYLDTTYRTIPKSSSRAIVGLSMGGYGALNLSMKYPDIFCIGYGISAGLFDENGLHDHIFNSDNKIKDFLDQQKSLALLSRENAHVSFMNFIQGLSNSDKFQYAYGLAFSPDTSLNAPYIKYPYSKVDDQLVVDSAILKNWESGFGNLQEKIVQYKDSLMKLKAYWFDYGTNDNYTWIPRGNKYYAELLTASKIPHRVFEHNGNHVNHTRQSIENYVMPLCDSILEFDNQHLNREADLLKFSCTGSISIDTVFSQNNFYELKVVVKDYMNLNNLAFSYSLSTGSKIYPSPATEKDYTKGKILYTVVSESTLDTTLYNIQVLNESALNIESSTNIMNVDDDVIIYPNPCNNGIINFKINAPDFYNGTITIYDISLRKLKNYSQINSTSSFIDLSDIDDKVVYIAIRNNNISICKKVVLID